MKVSLEWEIALFLVAHVNGDSVTVYQSQCLGCCLLCDLLPTSSWEKVCFDVVT